MLQRYSMTKSFQKAGKTAKHAMELVRPLDTLPEPRLTNSRAPISCFISPIRVTLSFGCCSNFHQTTRSFFTPSLVNYAG